MTVQLTVIAHLRAAEWADRRNARLSDQPDRADPHGSGLCGILVASGQ